MSAKKENAAIIGAGAAAPCAVRDRSWVFLPRSGWAPPPGSRCSAPRDRPRRRGGRVRVRAPTRRLVRVGRDTISGPGRAHRHRGPADADTRVRCVPALHVGPMGQLCRSPFAGVVLAVRGRDTERAVTPRQANRIGPLQWLAGPTRRRSLLARCRPRPCAAWPARRRGSGSQHPVGEVGFDAFGVEAFAEVHLPAIRCHGDVRPEYTWSPSSRCHVRSALTVSTLRSTVMSKLSAATPGRSICTHTSLPRRKASIGIATLPFERPAEPAEQRIEVTEGIVLDQHRFLLMLVGAC